MIETEPAHGAEAPPLTEAAARVVRRSARESTVSADVLAALGRSAGATSRAGGQRAPALKSSATASKAGDMPNETTETDGRLALLREEMGSLRWDVQPAALASRDSGPLSLPFVSIWNPMNRPQRLLEK